MTTDDALRFVAHEASWCRSRDEHEALCLLLPAVLRGMRLPPMDDVEARAFREQLKLSLVNEPERAAR